MTEDRTAQYRNRVLLRHAVAVGLHTRAAGLIERALMKPRVHRTHVHLVVDMLVVQALKAHGSVLLLAQHGLMEDAATATRRLLELSIQAVFIAMDDTAAVRAKRAGQYISFMWRDVPRRTKRQLPPKTRQYWSAIARSYGRFLRPKATSWGYKWIEQFEAIQPGMYRSDYALLSMIAHGASPEQIMNYSRSSVRIHSDRLASVILVYSTRYVLAAARVWRQFYRSIRKAELDALIDETAAVRFRDGMPVGAT